MIDFAFMSHVCVCEINARNTSGSNGVESSPSERDSETPSGDASQFTRPLCFLSAFMINGVSD